jgi:hypothetical protein
MSLPADLLLSTAINPSVCLFKHCVGMGIQYQRKILTYLYQNHKQNVRIEL